MRPTYHTEADLEAERVAAALIRRAWGLHPRKQEAFACLDFRLEFADGTAAAMAEIKRRTGNYPSVFLSLKKAPAIRAADAQGLDVLFFVLKRDGLHGAFLDPRLPYPRATAGRTDRGDPFDVEELALVPWAEFVVRMRFADFPDLRRRP